MAFLKRLLAPAKNSKQAMLTVGLILLTGTAAVFLTSFDLGSEVEVEQSVVSFAMKLYLILIFLRTVAHLILCFANTFFTTDKSGPTTRPLVSILVPCYNEETVLATAVRSILQFDYPNIEVIIIDDGSTDRTLEVAHTLQMKGRVRVIHQQNAGKAAALNRGLSECQGEYFMCMDADSLLRPNCIDQSLRYLQEDLTLAAVAGAVEIGNAKGVIPSFQQLEYISGLNLFKAAQSFLKSVTVIPGPVGLFRKSAVEAVGGYRTNTYAEDCELTLRLLTHGFGTIYVPTMIAVTEVPEDFASLISQRYRWSRGVVQAILANKKWILRPIRAPRNFFILSYMIIESIFIPICNFLFAFTALWFALERSSSLYGQLFLQLIFLDIVLAVYCTVSEQSPFRLVAYSILNRFTYGFSLEIIRFFSIVDECIQIPMSWGKLVRKGL